VGADPRPNSGLLRSGTITLASRLVVFVLSLAAGVVLARTLGPGGRGEYSLVLLGPSLVVLVANLGVSNALTYHLARRTFQIDHLIGQVISLALILGGTAAVGLIVVVALFGKVLLPGVPFNLVVIAALSVPLALFFYFTLSFSQGLEKFTAFNSLYLVNAAALLAFLVPMFWARGNVTLAVAAWSLSWVPTAVLGVAFLARWGRLNIRLDPAISKSLLRFGLVGYVSYLTYYLNIRLDTFLVNIFANATQVGYYAVAVSLAETIWYISSSASTVLIPRVAAGSSTDSDEATGRVSRVVLATTLLAGIALALIAPLLVRVLFGPAFQPTVIGVWLLLPGIVALGNARVLSGYLLGRNRQVVDLIASLVGLVATVILDLVLIPRYGFAGAAVASSIAYAITLAVDLRWVVHNSTLSVTDLLLPTRADLELIVRRMHDVFLGLRRRPA
jgi:O-antigen/teichoic acid export membrane protein